MFLLLVPFLFLYLRVIKGFARCPPPHFKSRPYLAWRETYDPRVSFGILFFFFSGYMVLANDHAGFLRLFQTKRFFPLRFIPMGVDLSFFSQPDFPP